MKAVLKDKHNLNLLRILFLCWLVTKFLCFDLWQGDRFFPLVPVHDILNQLPVITHAALFWGSVFLMFTGVIRPNKLTAIVILVFEMLSCLLDQSRWQPWEYQFLMMLAAYCIYDSDRHMRTAWQIIAVGLYFFSGLSKLNAGFIHDIWYNLILRNWLGVNTGSATVFRIGYLLPLLEMSSAIMLCFYNSRKWGVLLLCCMHGLILLMFGPLGLNRNEVIWPWNITMPILLIWLFNHEGLAWQASFFRKSFSYVIIGFFCLLPLLSLAGKWDRYLAFTLYSGNIKQLYICTDNPAALQKMSPYMGSIRNGMVPCRFPVSTYHWGIRAMKTAPYPQQRVYESIAIQFKKMFPEAKVKFYIYTSGFSPKVEEFIPE